MILSEIVKDIETLVYEKDKLNIFDYNINSQTTGRSALFVEIDGPSAHIKLYLKTEKEKNIIETAIHQLILERNTDLKKRLLIQCKNIIAEEEKDEEKS